MKNGKEKMMLVKEKKRILVLLLAIATVICFMPGFQAVAKAITVKSAADGTITVDYDNGGQDNYTLRKNGGEKTKFLHYKTLYARGTNCPYQGSPSSSQQKQCRRRKVLG